jgi:hypothetical protein
MCHLPLPTDSLHALDNCLGGCWLQVVVADTFTSLSVMHLGPDAWLSQRAVLLLVVGLLLLPCCFPRNLQAMGEQII